MVQEVLDLTGLFRIRGFFEECHQSVQGVHQGGFDRLALELRDEPAAGTGVRGPINGR